MWILRFFHIPFHQGVDYQAGALIIATRCLIALHKHWKRRITPYEAEVVNLRTHADPMRRYLQPLSSKTLLLEDADYSVV
jgi:hypothetical protein